MPAPTGAPAPTPKPALASAGSPTPVNAPGPITGLSKKDTDDIAYFVTGAFGNLRGQGGKGGAVRSKRGLDALARATGLDAMTLNLQLSEDKANAKQIAETVQRWGAIERLNNTLDQHGTLLENAIARVTDTGSPLFNTPIRAAQRKFTGDPDLAALGIAINAFQREYAYLTAGGAQSRAMLPVSTVENMHKLIDEGGTVGQIARVIAQVRAEAQVEGKAMQDTINGIRNRTIQGPISLALRGGASSPAQASPSNIGVGTVIPGLGKVVKVH
jgi:hypothetical protein